MTRHAYLRPLTMPGSLLATLCFLPTASWPQSPTPERPGASEVLRNEALVEAIAERLEHDRVVGKHGIDVEYRTGGIVVLSGIVDTLLAQERAGRIALAPDGVRGIVNRIQLQGRAATPDQIELGVRTELRSNPATEDVEIDIAVESGGKVRLTGNVSSLAQKDIADRIVKLQPGVTEVFNELKVYDSPFRRPPSHVLAEVRDVLAWDAFVDAENITVEMREGAVLLSGSVASAEELRRAQAVAWTSGANVVDAQNLAVEPIVQ